MRMFEALAKKLEAKSKTIPRVQPGNSYVLPEGTSIQDLIQSHGLEVRKVEFTGDGPGGQDILLTLSNGEKVWVKKHPSPKAKNVVGGMLVESPPYNPSGLDDLDLSK